jgi:hypothetical protein
MHNKKLSIAIPTYNRHEILYDNLKHILPELSRHSIAIFISDDSNNNSTSKIVESLLSEYIFIYYEKNYPSLGHDKNINKTLQLPDTEYIWLVGDSIIIKKGSIDHILNVLNNDLDFVFINAYAEGGYSSHHITDATTFMVDFTWYLTLTGATIYSNNVIRSFNILPNIVYYNNFQQVAIILNYLSDNDIKSYWVNEILITFNNKKISYWADKAFDVFVNDWTYLIRSFPRVFKNESVVKQVIYSHAKNTKVFCYNSLLEYSYNGTLNYKLLLSNYSNIAIALNRCFIVIFIISIMPKWLISTCIRFKKIVYK